MESPVSGTAQNLGVGERIAVVGSGVAGIVAAHLLSKKFRVTIFEADERLGGHTNTIDCDVVNDDGTGGSIAGGVAGSIGGSVAGRVGVDTGFIVCNDTTYPTFHRFLRELEVAWRFADMSVSVFDTGSGTQFCSRSLDAIFAQRKNLFSPRFIKMVVDIARFWQVASRDLKQGLTDDETLGEWLSRRGFSGAIVDLYLVPIAAAVWSSSARGILDFPVGTFLEFYRNHGFLRWYRQPRWQTVVGGSKSYLDAFVKRFAGEISLKTPVLGMDRNPAGVRLFGLEGRLLGEFSKVVVATHADQVLKVLGTAARPDEREIFGAWRYQENIAVLHQDDSVMPTEKRAWASWNYRRERDDGTGERAVSVSYHMNALQGLTCKPQFFVTLNPAPGATYRGELKRIAYDHPVYTREAVRARGRLQGLQGCDHTFFAGSYHGYGFHEDAVKSGVSVARSLGCDFSPER